jgi:hypothetical protein
VHNPVFGPCSFPLYDLSADAPFYSMITVDIDLDPNMVPCPLPLQSLRRNMSIVPISYGCLECFDCLACRIVASRRRLSTQTDSSSIEESVGLMATLLSRCGPCSGIGCSSSGSYSSKLKPDVAPPRLLPGPVSAAAAGPAVEVRG